MYPQYECIINRKEIGKNFKNLIFKNIQLFNDLYKVLLTFGETIEKIKKYE